MQLANMKPRCSLGAHKQPRPDAIRHNPSRLAVSMQAAHKPSPTTEQVTSLAAGVLASVLLVAGPATALDLEAVQANFSMKCVGCHQGGGNVLAVGASLFPEDLARNGYSDPQALFELIYKGKGKMPGYGQDCAPKGQCTFGPRLSDEQIQDLAAFVLLKAEAGWK